MLIQLQYHTHTHVSLGYVCSITYPTLLNDSDSTFTNMISMKYVTHMILLGFQINSTQFCSKHVFKYLQYITTNVATELSLKGQDIRKELSVCPHPLWSYGKTLSLSLYAYTYQNSPLRAFGSSYLKVIGFTIASILYSILQKKQTCTVCPILLAKPHTKIKLRIQ